MKLKFYCILCLLCVIGTGQVLFAQSLQIKGTVISKDDGTSLPGVNVVVKGTTRGISTDVYGKYTITAKTDETLVFSFIGFQTVEARVGTQTVINITLQSDAKNLDEIVVVGYGSKKRSDLIGSVSTVKTDKLIARPSSDLQGMLKGQVAGLYVNVGSARPGGSSNVLLRGTNSLKGSTSPLYIVDGFPVSSINEINVDDVETVSVLKDASAQAIYGARASNGVILITTRRGSDSKGKININYDGYLSVQNVKPNFEVFSPEEYMQLRREAFRGDKATEANGWTGDINDSTKYMPDNLIFTPVELQNIKDGSYVDWLDQAFKKNVLMTKHDLSLSGGNENTKYAASLGFYNQDGVRLSSDYKRYTGKLAIDQKINKRVTVGMMTFYSDYVQHQENSSWTDFITFSPIARLYDTITGELNLYPLGDFKSVNPLYWENTRSLTVSGNRGIYNGYLEVKPIEGLKYRMNASMDVRARETDDFKALNDPSSVLGKGFAQANFYTEKSYVLENILTYENKLENGNRFDITLLQSADKRKNTSTSSIANSLGNDFFGINSLGSALESSSARSQEKHTVLSFMGRINYIISDRYLLNFTMRSDGSSVFGINNKWGYFPSIAAAWNMQKENFLKDLAWIEESKIRLSYGQIGNEAISPYGSLSTANNAFYVSGGTPVIGYLPGSSLPNPNLKWETTTTINLGYDFSIFKQKLKGTFDIYSRVTKDLLVDRNIPTSLGYSTMPDNLGEIRNKGFEASLTGFIISNNNFTWMAGSTFSMNRNKLTKGVLRDMETGAYVDDVANKWFIGQPVNVYYDYKFDGIWQIGDDIANSAQPKARPGDVKIADSDHNDTITAADRVVINRDPKFILSFNTAIQYKGIELSADLYIVNGVTKSSPFMSDVNYGGSLQGYKNGIKRDYWTPENPSNSTFRPHETVTSEYRGTLDYQDASYVRLTNLTLAFTLPDKWAKAANFGRVRLYMRGDNLITITKYLSVSPETNPDSYPETVNYTFGINVNF
jgi:TonB-dependent starch-binding outer membrane protein SusC